MIDIRSKQLSEYILSDEKFDTNQLDLISWAENNRVLYTVATKSHLKSIKSIGGEWIKKLSKTLAEIKITLAKDEYIVTRTYKYIEYVTFDVDLFIESKNFKKTVDKFKSRGFKVESHDSSLGGRLPGMQVNIRKEGLLTIDLHQDFTWQKRKFLDSRLVMQNPVRKVIAGQVTFVPRPEIELLLCIADIAHERFNITLLDLIWLKGLSKEIDDWEFVMEQARKYKWLNVFKKISAIINQMSLDIYGEVIIADVAPKKGNYKLPYFLDLATCWGIYLNTLLGYRRFPLISFMYMHYNRIKFLLMNKMPYYSPWHNV